MKIRPGLLTFSATDSSNFLGCSHRAVLDRLSKLGGPKPPQYDDPGLEVLRQRGLEQAAVRDHAKVEAAESWSRVSADS